jgi:cytochrome-b5 reductase
MASSVSGLLDAASAFVADNAGVCLGLAVAVGLVVATQLAVSGGGRRGAAGLLSDGYVAVPLTQKTVLSHNTRLFRFALPTPETRLGLPLGRHMSLRAFVNGDETRRPYTPTSSDADLGFFDLLVKVYPAPHGKMSRHLDSLSVGDTVDIRGPLGKFTYERNSFEKIVMIAGGTGLTPCWQVFRELLADPEDLTELRLIFANVTEDDILLHDELDEIAAANKRFSVYYVLNKPPAGWTGGVGFVTPQMIKEQVDGTAAPSLFLYCGPPPMNKAVKMHLAGLGVSDKNIFKF